MYQVPIVVDFKLLIHGVHLESDFTNRNILAKIVGTLEKAETNFLDYFLVAWVLLGLSFRFEDNLVPANSCKDLFILLT